jgi:2-polyprenyl-3-methyl-5-hydroxy-6-metoxy-1,4-benzoquinol methylase
MKRLKMCRCKEMNPKVVPFPLIDIVWLRHEPPEIVECRFSYDFCPRTTRELCHEAGGLGAWIEMAPDTPAADLRARLEGRFAVLVSHPELVLVPEALGRMVRSLSRGYGACLPVYNETDQPLQGVELPAFYLNLATLREIAGLLAATTRPVAPLPADAVPDFACIMVRREVLERHLDADLNVAALPERIVAQERPVVDAGALVHTFGRYYGAEREDLVQLVPEAAVRVLDVGCAMGGFGRRLRRLRPDVELTGVEMNPTMAAAAKGHYDRVHCRRIEEIDFPAHFDHINCGDIIEHLDDPWAMLARFYDLLQPGGTLVLSLPNAGHWTIVRDLAAGRFQYIPVGLLCLTHIRWFTETSIREALENAGFGIDLFRREQVPPTPAGARFIDDLCRLGHGDRESLLTNELTLRAVKP